MTNVLNQTTTVNYCRHSSSTKIRKYKKNCETKYKDAKGIHILSNKNLNSNDKISMLDAEKRDGLACEVM